MFHLWWRVEINQNIFDTIFGTLRLLPSESFNVLDEKESTCLGIITLGSRTGISQ